jgi:hypothetical protein
MGNYQASNSASRIALNKTKRTPIYSGYSKSDIVTAVSATGEVDPTHDRPLILTNFAAIKT